MSNSRLQAAIRNLENAEVRVERQRQLVARLECFASAEAIETALETLIVLQNCVALRRYNVDRIKRAMGVEGPAWL